MEDSIQVCETELKELEAQLSTFDSGNNMPGSAQHYGRLRERVSELSEQLRHLRKQAADQHR